MNKFTVNRFLTGVANTLSTALSPLLMPTYGVFLVMWVSVLCLLPYGTRVSVLLVCMGITCIIPIIFLSVMRHFKLIKDLHVDVMEERLYPYLFTALCYLVAAYYLYCSIVTVRPAGAVIYRCITSALGFILDITAGEFYCIVWGVVRIEAYVRFLPCYCAGVYSAGVHLPLRLV